MHLEYLLGSFHNDFNHLQTFLETLKKFCPKSNILNFLWAVYTNMLYIKHIVILTINSLDNSWDFWDWVPYYYILNSTKSTTNTKFKFVHLENLLGSFYNDFNHLQTFLENFHPKSNILNFLWTVYTSRLIFLANKKRLFWRAFNIY